MQRNNTKDTVQTSDAVIDDDGPQLKTRSNIIADLVHLEETEGKTYNVFLDFIKMYNVTNVFLFFLVQFVCAILTLLVYNSNNS